MRKHLIGVMGGGDDAPPSDVEWGYELGKLIAAQGWILLSGGRNVGVMNSSCRGAREAGGLVVGILPGDSADDASDAVDIAIVTAMGSARNNINVLSSEVVVACGETSPGTLSEICLALKAKRHVVILNTDTKTREFLVEIGKDLIHLASTPAEVISIVSDLLKSST